jgi:hypothetical protein
MYRSCHHIRLSTNEIIELYERENSSSVGFFVIVWYSIYTGSAISWTNFDFLHFWQSAWVSKLFSVFSFAKTTYHKIYGELAKFLICVSQTSTYCMDTFCIFCKILTNILHAFLSFHTISVLAMNSLYQWTWDNLSVEVFTSIELLFISALVVTNCNFACKN